jgi:hypothetical protein
MYFDFWWQAEGCADIVLAVCSDCSRATLRSRFWALAMVFRGRTLQRLALPFACCACHLLRAMSVARTRWRTRRGSGALRGRS